MFDVRSLPELTFPAGFLWGAATAAYQIEGDNFHSDHWHREKAGGPLAKSGKACNSWELYKEDIALVRALGLKAYRFSLEWARIEPDEGTIDQAAVAQYVDQCARLADAGIQPWITLHHITHPQWFAARGDWLEKANIEAYLRYADFIVPKIAPYAAGWTPINEYNLHGGMPAQPEAHKAAAARKLHALLADAGTYDRIKAHSGKPVGSSIAYVYFQPSRPSRELDDIMARYTAWCSWGFYYHAIRTGEWLYPFAEGGSYPELKGRADQWAVNIYTRHMVDSRQADLRGTRFPYSHLPLLDIPFYTDEFAPDALLFNLQRLTDKPVMITENGWACNDDRFRIAYLAVHLAAFHRAIADGVDLRGWFHWSLMDNYEWGSFKPRFGFYRVDRQTFERTAKPSAGFVRQVAARNGLSGELVREYLDRLPSRADD